MGLHDCMPLRVTTHSTLHSEDCYTSDEIKPIAVSQRKVVKQLELRKCLIASMNFALTASVLFLLNHSYVGLSDNSRNWCTHLDLAFIYYMDL